MVSLDLSEIIPQKNLNAREIDFIKKLVKHGGQFSNKELARYWGTKTFPTSLKKILLSKPPILNLIQNKPQIYILISEKDDIKVILEEKEYIPPMDKQDVIHQDFQTLKEDYYNFKIHINEQFQNVLNDIKSIKRIINIPIAKEKVQKFLMRISDLEREISIIYNQLKMRPHQPIKIEDIWNQLYLKYPDYNWEAFSSQILKIHSNSFHLEEGTVGRHILDSVTNKKYGYVIGN